MGFMPPRQEEPATTQPIDYSYAPHDSGVSFTDCSVGSPEYNGNSSSNSETNLSDAEQKIDVCVSDEVGAFSPKNEKIELAHPNSASSPIIQPHPISYPAENEQNLQNFQQSFFYEHAHLFQQYEEQQQNLIQQQQAQNQQPVGPKSPVDSPVKPLIEEVVRQRSRKSDNREFYFLEHFKLVLTLMSKH